MLKSRQLSSDSRIRIDYLEPDDVDFGNQFEAILPSLWLAAGGKGDRKGITSDLEFCIPLGSQYAILFKEKSFRKLRKELEQRQDVTHVWIVTDSEDAFAEMRSALPSRLSPAADDQSRVESRGVDPPRFGHGAGPLRE